MHISTNDLHCCKSARLLQLAPSGGRPRSRPPATAPPRIVPPVTRDQAYELVLQHIEHDPSLESLRELYEQDLAKPELDIFTVTGLKCIGMLIGTPEFVNSFL
jgi:hypothetical protein